MTADVQIQTERLVLRRWTDDDRHAFRALNSDPAVMATIGPVMNREQSDAFMDRIDGHFREHGFGLWCVDRDREVLGFAGLSRPWFRDGVEIGWRMRSRYWGHGYATEAARAALSVGFDQVGLDEVVSFTAMINRRSERVMEKIGMIRDHQGDFDHPSIPAGSELSAHVLYRLSAARYRAQL